MPEITHDNGPPPKERAGQPANVLALDGASVPRAGKLGIAWWAWASWIIVMICLGSAAYAGGWRGVAAFTVVAILASAGFVLANGELDG